MGIRKKYPPEFKAKVVLEILKETKSISEISSEYGVHPSQLVRWKNEAVQGLPRLFSDEGKTIENLKIQHEKEVQELYGEIGRLTTELAWLKKKMLR